MASNKDKLNRILSRKAGILARKALNNPKLAKRIQNKLLLNIKKNGILPSGSRAKSLSTSWVKQRGKLSKLNNTSRYYKKFFSNLTFTGQFLKSFKAKITEKTSKLGKSSVLFETAPTGDHKPYKRTKGHVNFKEGNTIANAKLGQYLIDGGRDYTAIGPQVKKQITKSIKSAILREFKLNLKRK